MTVSPDWSDDQNICFIGFGEAGEALSGGFRSHGSVAWDKKLLVDRRGFENGSKTQGSNQQNHWRMHWMVLTGLSA